MVVIVILLVILLAYRYVHKELLYKNQLTSIEIELNTPTLNSSSYKQRFQFVAYIETSASNYEEISPSIDYVTDPNDVMGSYQVMTSVSGNTKKITWNDDTSQNQIVRNVFNAIKDKLPDYGESDYNQKLKLEIKTIYYTDSNPNLIESSTLNPEPITEMGQGTIPIPTNVSNVSVEFITL